MSFNGDEGTFVSITEAAGLTANYRTSSSSSSSTTSTTSTSSSSSLILGHFLGKEKLLELLNQSECVGLRIYHGRSGTSGLTPEIVVVGVDSNENDILPTSNALILDRSLPCPPTCGNSNALNS